VCEGDRIWLRLQSEGIVVDVHRSEDHGASSFRLLLSGHRLDRASLRLVRVLGLGGERCAAIVALSYGRWYSSSVRRPYSV